MDVFSVKLPSGQVGESFKLFGEKKRALERLLHGQMKLDITRQLTPFQDLIVDDGMCK